MREETQNHRWGGKTVTFYDDADRVVRDVEYDADGSILREDKREYDERGNQTGYKAFNRQGTLVYESRENPETFLDEIWHYDNSGQLKAHTTQTRDDKQRVVQTTRNAEGEIVHCTTDKEETDPRFYLLRNAACWNLEEAHRLVLEDPTIVEARNSIGETALHFLVVENALEAVAFLAQHGSQVNTRNAFRNSALSEAVQLGYVEMVELLLPLGARISACQAEEIIEELEAEIQEQMRVLLARHGVILNGRD